ncbi:MAG: hypothetical protein OXF48_02150 [Bacteroidetes bacterium]|nr:hypothetical protein [Bacteroidota bacterium]
MQDNGVAKDLVDAKWWYMKAAKSGIEDAQNRRNHLVSCGVIPKTGQTIA